ncbi:MAG: quinol:cytochrome C oxidoreductase [Bacteroidetes bacterium]|nr:MAG: quinol:cytochrome C oxidoreductase [Bacteroidota bacterium]
MGIGIVAFIAGLMGVFGADGEEAHHVASTRLWSNILINGFFFFGIALIAVFFIAVQYAAEAGWAVVFKRVFEAIAEYLPIGAAFLVIVWLAGSFHLNHLYHWMDPEAVAHDPILQHKTPYLNLPFFWIRALVFLGVYIWFAKVMRKRSLMEDEMPDDKGWFLKNQRSSAMFLVFFGFTSTVAAWDWLMSIDTHWFSTLYGWYVFSGMWISFITAATLIVVYLKSQGYLQFVTKYHLQDMGKWMFAVSFLWTYLWFSQYMLIWYADIPEEVTYFIPRIEDYTVGYWMMVIGNFIFPMLLLMDKDNKRSQALLALTGIIIFIFHWLDAYFLITPGTMRNHGHLGFVEIGLFLGFLGLFMLVVFNALTKAPLLVKHHAYLDESLHLEQN